jgi:5-deoxy-D-glucuronate isomerase
VTVQLSAFSSTPHEFETRPEPGFEEAFYFLFPEGGKGLLEGQGLWPDGTEVDDAWPVRHRQLAQVPMGWHRVTALPGVDGDVPRLAYVWVYLCTRPEWEKDND